MRKKDSYKVKGGKRMQDIEKIYQEYASAVYKYIFCLTKNEDLSEEITQETFVRAVKEIKKFKGECKISVWLCQIAKHIYFKTLKEKKKYQEVQIQEYSDLLFENDTIEDLYCKNEEKLEIFRKIQRLDEKTKNVMYLKIAGDLTFKEIGEIMNQSENWERVTFYRGKKKIKEEKQ